jgi:hypothetical protein
MRSSEQARLSKALALGPAFFLLGAFWGNNAYPETVSADWFPPLIFLGLPVMLAWHFATLWRHRDATGYLLYAVVTVFLYVMVLTGLAGK